MASKRARILRLGTTACARRRGSMQSCQLESAADWSWESAGPIDIRQNVEAARRKPEGKAGSDRRGGA
eukprot:7170612-Prymnesium_polylepis.1